MILPFFTKRIRQPSQSADVHSDRQIVPFGVRCANSILIGIAVAYVLARLDYFARRVAMLICGGAVYFDYLGKIDAPTKRGGDGGSVRGVAIRAELEATGQPIGPYDMMIAATGRAHALTVITANTGEFERVVALRVENWLD